MHHGSVARGDRAITTAGPPVPGTSASQVRRARRALNEGRHPPGSYFLVRLPSAFAIFCSAMTPIATFLSLRDALYFLSDFVAASSASVLALPWHHSCWMVSLAVRRFLGSSSSNIWTRFLASCEMLSHHGDGKSYLEA